MGHPLAHRNFNLRIRTRAWTGTLAGACSCTHDPIGYFNYWTDTLHSSHDLVKLCWCKENPVRNSDSDLHYHIDRQWGPAIYCLIKFFIENYKWQQYIESAYC